MDARDRAQRVIGLQAIKARAEDLASKGSDPLEVRAFIKGAKGELARQKPDWQQYAKAMQASDMAQGTFQ